MKTTYLKVEASYHIASAVILERAGKELAREVKVKLMSLRINLSRHVKRFREDVQAAANSLMAGEYNDLCERLKVWTDEGKTATEKAQHLTDKAAFSKLEEKLNADCNAFAKAKYDEEVDVATVVFTDEEFAEILDVNSANDVTLQNGRALKAADLMEAFYELFVQAPEVKQEKKQRK